VGLSASQARYLDLTARASDLELTGQQINQARAQLANDANELFSNTANLEPNSDTSLRAQLEINRLQQLDKAYELELRRVDTQHQTVQTEIEAVRKIIDRNIDAVFKVFS
jgi:hypothetical protein